MQDMKLVDISAEKKRKYLKAKINNLEINSKNKNIRELYRGISDFKEGYQPRTIIVKDEKGDLVADCHSILTRWRNYVCQLFNVHGDSYDRQAEKRTAEPLVPQPSVFEIKMAIEKLRGHQSPGTLEILMKNCLSSGRSQSLCLFIRRVIKHCNNYRGTSLLSTTYKILSNIFL
jgi:hypothetical protein